MGGGGGEGGGGRGGERIIVFLFQSDKIRTLVAMETYSLTYNGKSGNCCLTADIYLFFFYFFFFVQNCFLSSPL